MKFVSSLVVVGDIGAARFLYEKILKQRVSADYGENLVFEGGFCLHLKDHFRKLIDGREVAARSNSCELYFEDDDLEGLERELDAHDFEFVHRIREQPWKQRVLRFYDRDGNLIEVGEPLPA